LPVNPVREFDEKSITQAVIGRLAECQDPRFARLMTSLVTHLHDFVREVQLTESEWFTAIEFLTDVGKACTAKRQEFIRGQRRIDGPGPVLLGGRPGAAARQ